MPKENDEIKIALGGNGVISYDRISRMVAESIREDLDSKLQKMVEKEIGKAIHAVTEKKLGAALDKIIADGWDQTSCLGERTGKKITIGGLVLEKIQGKDGYDKSTLVDRIVATKFDSALKTELQPIVEEAKKKFRASIDNIMQTKLQAVLKESLGLK